MTDQNRKRALRQPSDAEVKHLAETTDLSPNQARELIRKHGDDPDKLREQARNYKAES
jgi:hypothetical protein